MTISAVLVRQTGVDHHLVYYISYLFKGPKLHYISLEKLTLGLILVTRHLGSYFLLHRIVVLTNTLVRHILTHLEAIGRLIKWAIELSECDIK